MNIKLYLRFLWIIDFILNFQKIIFIVFDVLNYDFIILFNTHFKDLISGLRLFVVI